MCVPAVWEGLDSQCWSFGDPLNTRSRERRSWNSNDKMLVSGRREVVVSVQQQLYCVAEKGRM